MSGDKRLMQASGHKGLDVGGGEIKSDAIKNNIA